MKRFLLLIAIICTVMKIQAQIITWAVKPGVYTKIEPCWGDMYFAYYGNNVGVIEGDGRVIVKPEANRITGFYGGLALVLKSDGGQERILGILSTDGSYSKIDGTYFTIPYQEFFSEGLLTVKSPRGQTGYMNGNGVVVKSFNLPFISPFSEGYAVVGENEEYSIIDKRFNILNIQLGTISQVYGGSNVYKGKAIIWDGNRKFYNFDVNSGTCKKISEPSSLDYDYMYCFSCITNRSETVPYERTQRSPETLFVTEHGGKYGYINGDKVVLPYQFEQAENFHGNYAIVKVNGKYALLSLHNTSDEFVAKADSDIKYKKSSGKNLVHRFGITLPNLWSGDNLVVKVKDENGFPVNILNNEGSYEFKVDGGDGTKKYVVEIDGDGLKLWSGEIAYNYTVEEDPKVIEEGVRFVRYKPLAITLKATNTQADKNNRCYVRATISNPNPDPITATVSMTGSNLLECVSQRVTIPAFGSKDVSTYFIVKKATSGQKVVVSTSAGGYAMLDGLQLIPF